MIRLFLLLTIIFCLGFSTSGEAQTLPEKQVEEMARYVHDHMAGLMVGEGHLITEDEAKKLVYPLVPKDSIERTIIRGYIAGFANVCGLEWQKDFFLPYMRSVRGTHKDWNDYQFAYIGALHGTSMKSAEQSMVNKPCTEDFKQKLLAQK